MIATLALSDSIGRANYGDVAGGPSRRRLLHFADAEAEA